MRKPAEAFDDAQVPKGVVETLAGVAGGAE